MTTMDLSGLRDLKQRKPSKKTARTVEPWAPLDLATLLPGLYLCADQSISAFGIVLFEVKDSGPWVHAAAKFSVEAVAKGHEDTLQRTETIQCLVEGFLGDHVVPRLLYVAPPVLLISHEAPPTGGGKLSRPEVSLITSYAFRAAMRQVWPDSSTRPLRLLPMMRRQDHAKLICGNANATKPVHHAALKQLYPGIHGAAERVTNEAHRDALSVALAVAHRPRKDT